MYRNIMNFLSEYGEFLGFIVVRRYTRGSQAVTSVVQDRVSAVKDNSTKTSKKGVQV